MSINRSVTRSRMKPITGIVVEYDTKTMRIETEFGRIFHQHPIEGIEKGDVVEIDYDFTHNRVRSIRLSGAQDDGPPVDPKTEPEVPKEEVKIYASEGALSFPVCEGMGALSFPFEEDDGDVPLFE